MGITSSNHFLEQFFRNLLLGETVELRNRELHTEFKSNVGVNVGVNEQKAVDLITRNKNITAKLIAEELNISHRQAERIISELKKKNIIQRVGSDKAGYWEVIS